MDKSQSEGQSTGLLDRAGDTMEKLCTIQRGDTRLEGLSTAWELSHRRKVFGGNQGMAICAPLETRQSTRASLGEPKSFIQDSNIAHISMASYINDNVHFRLDMGCLTRSARILRQLS